MRAKPQGGPSSTTAPKQPAPAAPKPDPKVLAAQVELAQRILAKRHLIPFTQRINPRYSAGWVHQDIARRLERFSREVAEGKSPRLMVLMPPRHGKLLADSVRVPTPTGWRAHGDLRAGDMVFHPSGRPIRILAVSAPDEASLEVTTMVGDVIKCHPNHEWTVYDRSRGAWRTVETRYLASQTLTGPGGRARFQLPAADALQAPEIDLPIDPYFLGAWLGDGKSSEPVICGAQADLDHIVAKVPYPLGARQIHPQTGVHYQTFVGGVRAALRTSGLLNDKHIPEAYFMASIDQRRALLAGLVDTDGSVEPGTQRVRFRSGSERLAADVQRLVRSLGYRASTDHTPADERDREICGGESWCVQWTPHDGAGGGTLPRKVITRKRNRRLVGLRSVTPAAVVERGHCIQVDSPDGLYLVGDHLTATHNSELASRMFPAWHLGHYPEHEIIACSYNVSLAMSFSRKVKEVLVDPGYQSVFTTRLHPDFQANEEWGIAGTRGGYVAAGVGGGITGKGAHCLPAGTQVLTVDGQVDIAHLYRLKSKPLVQTPVGPRQILAMTRREASEGHYVLRFASGATLQATGKHPLYLPDRGGYASVEELYGEAESDGGLGVRVVRAAVPAPAVRPQQVDPAGVDGVLLQQGLQSGAPRSEERQAVRGMRQAGGGEPQEPQRDVLQQGLHPLQENPRAEDLPGVLRGVSAQVFTDGLLRGDLREYGALDPYAWGGELELQGRQFLQLVVQPGSQARAGEGCTVRGLRSDAESPLPSHRSRPKKQPGGESGHAVRDVSHRPPQVCYDTLAMVERVCPGGVEVYDIQVEEAGCFFADSVLVGNCLIIDDPIKNAEEADSADVREKLWDWYGSTAYTRLAPGGGVLVIQTWWHDDDLAGKLQTAMASDPEADQFEIVKYPAIAEHDEYLDDETDLIVYDEPPASGRMLRKKGEALHPERYDLVKLNRIRKTIPNRFWAALYQQNPVPDDGAYFTKEQFRQGPLPPLKRANVYVAFDFAISEKKHNDYTVGSVGLQDENDILHVADMVRFKSGDAFFIVESILNLCQKWYSPNLILGMEDGQIYRAIESLLKKRMRERKFYPSVVLLKPITDKQARARPLQGRMQQGMVSFAEGAGWYDAARTEMLRFPAGVHDDQVDSLAWMTTMAVGREPPRAQQAKPMKSWKDKVRSLMGGGGSHMTA